jgi:alpha-aminoadipic semialdehyde synthase
MAHLVANYFSWNPVGAIRAGRNPATYKDHGKTVHIDGKLSSIIL